jgi:hypothetical protein
VGGSGRALGDRGGGDPTEPGIDPATLRPGTPREFAMLISGSAHPVTASDWQRSLPATNPDLAERVPGIYQADERLEGPGGPLRPLAGGPEVVVVDNRWGRAGRGRWEFAQLRGTGRDERARAGRGVR